MTNSESADGVLRTLHTIGDVFQDLVGLADKTGALLYLNHAGRKMVGIAGAEPLPPITVQKLFPDWSPNNLMSRGQVDDATVSLSMRRNATLSTSDGRALPTHLSVHAHASVDFEFEFFLLVARDLTIHKVAEDGGQTLEDRLLDACRMGTYGRLSVGIARNLRHTIDQIGQRTQAALRLSGQSNEVQEPLEQTIRATDWASRAVAQIIEAGSASYDPGEPVPIRRLISDIVSMVRTSLPGTIVIRQHLEEGVDPIVLDPQRIRDIILNLVLHARDVLENTGGVLDIRLNAVGVGAGTGGSDHRPKPRRFVRVSVSDNGPGMPDEALSEIFTPPHSTEIPVESKRIGLCVMHCLVEACGGTVTVHNRVGRGTTFHVFLPTEDTKTAPVS